MEYDVIGDVHGNADALEVLLLRMGYTERSGAWSPPHNRTAIFVGDLIDRGSRQIDSVRIARGMVDAGHAHALLGNHELNAMAWLKECRPDTPKNRKQHGEFLAQVGEASRQHVEMVEWFQTLDLWLELPGLRAVHACWHPRAIAVAQEILGGQKLEFDFIERATARPSKTYLADSTDLAGDSLFWAVETLTKGVEVDLPEGICFRDKDGHERDNVRLKWWLDSPTFQQAAFLPEGYQDQRLQRVLGPGIVPGYDNSKPVFVGHYWRTGSPELLTPYVACVDYSAGRGGPLIAYQWRGEQELSSANFVSSH